MEQRVFRMDMFYPSTVDVPGRICEFYSFLQTFAPGTESFYRNGNGFTVSVVGSGEKNVRPGILAAAREIFV